MSVYIERWDGQHHSACRIFDIVELCHPLLPKADRAHVLNLISSRNRGYENSAFVAWNKNQICGFAMIFRGPVDDAVKVVGAHSVTTQNHHHNPMRELNQRLGFKTLDALVSFTKEV